jgi:hypothetical protein
MVGHRWKKLWIPAVLIKRESESLIFAGLKIPRDYCRIREAANL